jgi:hypothetical protein
MTTLLSYKHHTLVPKLVKHRPGNNYSAHVPVTLSFQHPTIMKSLKIMLVVLFVSQGALYAQAQQQNFNFLNNYNGKYPYEVKLLKNTQIKNALMKLLGNRYNFFVKTWAVETPITVKDGTFVASACMAHNCSDTNFIIVVDIENKKVYAGIREDNKVTTYPAGANYPQAIQDWVNNN